MYQEFFSKSPLLAMPLVALFLFIVVFASIIVRTFGRRGREAAHAAERLPLDADENDGNGRNGDAPERAGDRRA